MTHRGPFQPLLFCDSVTSHHDSVLRTAREHPSCSGAVALGPILSLKYILTMVSDP